MTYHVGKIPGIFTRLLVIFEKSPELFTRFSIMLIKLRVRMPKALITLTALALMLIH